MAEPSAAPSCPLDVPDEDWAEAVRREEFLTISGTPRAAQRTLTQQPQRWVESHDRGTTPTVLRSCRGESHDPGKATAARPRPGASQVGPVCTESESEPD